MTPVNAEKYYKANIDEEKEYVRLAFGREVKKGDIIFVDTIGGNEQATAPEDGYEVKHVNGKQSFVSTANALPAEELELPVPRKDLTAAYIKKIKPLKKGDEITFTPAKEGEEPDGIDNIYPTYAEKDGFIIALANEKEPAFMSNFELTSCFNYAGQRYGTDKEIIIADKNKPPVTGILIKEDTVFDFKGGECFAPAGSLLYKNPHDEDGYTVDDWMKWPNTALRVSPGWMEQLAQKARHIATLKTQEQLRKLPRIKLT
jgi:hypothetical protein